MVDSRTDDELAEILWDYNRLQQPLHPADCIVGLGSSDVRVAQRAAELWLQGLAPIIIFSGNAGVATRELFDKPEAEVFADRAVAMGVPRESIILEDRATNTGENIIFTKQLIAERQLDVASIILVQKPYMLRRSFATFKKQWPEMEIMVTGPEIDFRDYPNDVITKQQFYNILVGDTQRIKLYPAKGFQIPQEMPDEVWQVVQELIKRGYNQRLVSD